MALKVVRIHELAVSQELRELQAVRETGPP